MVVIPWIKALHFLSTCSMCYNPLFLIYLIFVLFVCLFFPTQIPQLLCLHLVQVCILLKLSEYCFSLLVLFLLFASSHFSHIFLLLLVFFPVLRCDKISFTSNIWQLSPSAAFVNHYFGNFSLPFMLPFMFLFMLGSFMSLKEWTFIWMLECGAILTPGKPGAILRFSFRIHQISIQKQGFKKKCHFIWWLTLHLLCQEFIWTCYLNCKGLH